MLQVETLASHVDPLADSRVARILERAGAAERAGEEGWRPFATAPRDGRQILAWVTWRNALPSPAIVQFDGRSWRRQSTSRGIEPSAMTHWRPLPDAPRSQSPTGA